MFQFNFFIYCLSIWTFIIICIFLSFLISSQLILTLDSKTSSWWSVVRLSKSMVNGEWFLYVSWPPMHSLIRIFFSGGDECIFFHMAAWGPFFNRFWACVEAVESKLRRRGWYSNGQWNCNDKVFRLGSRDSKEMSVHHWSIITYGQSYGRWDWHMDVESGVCIWVCRQQSISSLSSSFRHHAVTSENHWFRVQNFRIENWESRKNLHWSKLCQWSPWSIVHVFPLTVVLHFKDRVWSNLECISH